MKQIYKHVREWFTLSRKRSMKWSELIPEGGDRETKMHTFLPLLHLGTQRKIDIEQKEAFGDFDISIPKPEKKA